MPTYLNYLSTPIYRIIVCVPTLSPSSPRSYRQNRILLGLGEDVFAYATVSSYSFTHSEPQFQILATLLLRWMSRYPSNLRSPKPIWMIFKIEALKHLPEI